VKLSDTSKRTSFNFLDEIFNRLLEDENIRFYLKSSNKKIIPLPIVNRRLGVLYHFSKQKTMQILKELERKRLIKIVSFHGIKIKKSIFQISQSCNNRIF
jgi:hypothetical protein